MRQFFGTSAPHSSAEQPARNSAIRASAAQPALQSIRDVQRWLASESLPSGSTEMQRVRAAVQVLAAAKPRQEDIRPLQSPSNWNVPGKVKQKPRPLPDVIEELKGKVLQAARKLQRELGESRSSESGSAEQPASSSAEQPALTIASAIASSVAVSVEKSRRTREELQENQRKRNQTSEPEPPRPLAKPKPSDRRGKRSTQAKEQLPSKSKRGKLTTESFAVSAAPFVDAEASSSSAAQPAPTQFVHLKRAMYQLKMELKEFKDSAWISKNQIEEVSVFARSACA